jgi:hypothetical protein
MIKLWQFQEEQADKNAVREAIGMISQVQAGLEGQAYQVQRQEMEKLRPRIGQALATQFGGDPQKLATANMALEPFFDQQWRKGEKEVEDTSYLGDLGSKLVSGTENLGASIGNFIVDFGGRGVAKAAEALGNTEMAERIRAGSHEQTSAVNQIVEKRRQAAVEASPRQRNMQALEQHQAVKAWAPLIDRPMASWPARPGGNTPTGLRSGWPLTWTPPTPRRASRHTSWSARGPRTSIPPRASCSTRRSPRRTRSRTACCMPLSRLRR